MGLNITIRYMDDSSTSTSMAARDLAQKIKNTIPDGSSGQIDIIVDVNVPFGIAQDVDILLVANLQNCVVGIGGQDISVKSFCTTIELKEHIVDDVKATNTDVLVYYRKTDYWKNASGQSRKQKNSILKYCGCHSLNKIIVSNILWLKSVSEDDWDNSIRVPILLSDFTFDDIINQITLSGHKLHNGSLAIYDNATDELDQLITGLAVARPIPSSNLRSKIEYLVRNQLEDVVTQIVNTDDFSCVDGKAGTGKTFLLLQAALKYAADDYSCALLTYNKALTLDLQRLVYFLGMPTETRNNLDISTLHSYMGSITKALGWNRGYDPNGAAMRDYIQNLYRQGGCTLYESGMYSLDDFVFIDEAQDCTQIEQEILKYIWPENRIVVAKSALQKIRRDGAAKWGKPTIKLTSGLRQKSNIVSFLQSLTAQMGIADTCAGNSSAIEGGRVIIVPQYLSGLHFDLETYCSQSGCSNYDILMLVPPTMVENRVFIKADVWRSAGIKFIDGTNTSALEACTPAELLESCRIYQYESCRGLEGWVAVCYELDEIIRCKSQEIQIGENVIGDPHILRMQATYQWIMMPLTRAIDTLVITVKEINSPIAEMLRNVAKQHGDFVDCQI